MLAQLINLILTLAVILGLIAIGLAIAGAKWRPFRTLREGYFVLLKWIFVTAATTLWRAEIDRDGIGQEAPPLYDREERR